MRTDYSGQVFGRLTVLRYSHSDRYKSAHNEQTKPVWLCRCECGTEKLIRSEHLVKQTVQSCGCLAREKAAARLRTHGLTKTRTYHIWSSMKQRALNKNMVASNSKLATYKDVGICERWKKFENFLADMGECPSSKHEIDRIDNEGDYEPSNCKWSTRLEQMLNQKRNHLIYKEYLSLNPSVTYKMYRTRVRNGWDKQKAAAHPKMKNQFI